MFVSAENPKRSEISCLLLIIIFSPDTKECVNFHLIVMAPHDVVWRLRLCPYDTSHVQGGTSVHVDVRTSENFCHRFWKKNGSFLSCPCPCPCPCLGPIENLLERDLSSSFCLWPLSLHQSRYWILWISYNVWVFAIMCSWITHLSFSIKLFHGSHIFYEKQEKLKAIAIESC